VQQHFPELSAAIAAAADCIIPTFLFCTFVALTMLTIDLFVALWRWAWRRK